MSTQPSTTSITNLPYEVIELILNILLQSLKDDGQPKSLLTIFTGQLRLVSKAWADAFRDRLYLSLTIVNDQRSCQVLSHWNQVTDPTQVIPRTQKLSIKQLWIGDPIETNRDESFSSFANLDRLLLLFADSLTELELEFIDCFDFPSSTVQIINKLKCLSILRISIIAERIITLNNNLAPSWSGTRGSHQPNHLVPILRAARNLTQLDFNHLPHLPLPHAPLPSSLPAIYQLEFDYFGQQSSETLVNLCLALKNSLRVLSIRGFRQDPLRLVPVFEAVRDQLEGLFVSDETLLTHVFEQSFPCLRVFRINYWAECIGQFLTRPLFHQLTTLALYSHTVHRRRRRFRVNPFQSNPALQQLIFTHTHVEDQPPSNYVEACRVQGVELIHIGQGDIQYIMVRNLLALFVERLTLLH